MAMLALLTRIFIFCPRYKVIARYSGMPSDDIRSGGLSGWRFWLVKVVYRYADAVIAQTQEMARELNQHYKIPKERIHQITNPVDRGYIETCLIGEKNPFCCDKINIVASGTVYPVKGFDVLLDAFSLIVAQNEKFNLHILGTDHDGNLAILQKRVGELGLSRHVTFHGFKKNPYPFYKFCDLFVLSSRHEALPNVLLECLYLKKPVVATRCAAVVERLVDCGNNGFLVDVDDCEGMAKAILKFKLLSGGGSIVEENGIVKLIDCLSDGVL